MTVAQYPHSSQASLYPQSAVIGFERDDLSHLSTTREDFSQWVEHTTSVISSGHHLTAATNSLTALSVNGVQPTFPQLDRYKPLPPIPINQERHDQRDTQKSKLQKTLQIVGCFCACLNSWGLLNSYGVFQAYYAMHLKPVPSPLQLGWIGSTQTFLLLLVSVLAGPAIDAGYIRYVTCVGSVLYAGGLLAMSFSIHFYQLILAQGVVTGVAAGLMYLPSIAIPPHYVGPRHRTTILGIVAAGSSVGGIVFPAIFKKLVPEIGFGGAVRVITSVIVPLNVFATLLLRLPTSPPAGTRALFDASMFKEPTYSILCVSAFFAFVGMYIPIFFIEQYALDYTSIAPELASYLVPIVMAGSLAGRIVPNMVAEKLQKPLLLLIGTACLASLLCFVWIALESASPGGLVVFSISYGFASGAYLSLMPPVVVALAPDAERLGTRFGMILVCGAFGSLVGTPVAGAILADTQKYVGLQCFAGLALMLAALLLLRIRVINK